MGVFVIKFQDFYLLIYMYLFVLINYDYGINIIRGIN